mmetsp:Transcript_19582/g.25361  ORF Transcript_19582/g.25361 Transcript_19582/m.25361 type:complete len:352 (-) Transcript_19582:2215-3270(-)
MVLIRLCGVPVVALGWLGFISSLGVVPDHGRARPTVDSRRLFIFGATGNLGRSVAELAHESSYFDGPVCGTFQFEDEVVKKGLTDCCTFIPFEDDKSVKSALELTTHVLVTIPPIIQDDYEYFDIVINKYIDYFPLKSWVGFISTTGVYGDHRGNWVDESSETKVLKDQRKASAFLESERKWKQISETKNISLTIFRCAGLYSNSASALHTCLKRGYTAPNVGPNKESYTSRIHVFDASRAILASMKIQFIPNHFEIFNLADTEPARRSEVMAFSTLMLSENGFRSQLNYLETIKKTHSVNERTNRRSIDNKRVDSSKMMNTLLNDEGLIFPSFREGLAHILRHLISTSKL